MIPLSPINSAPLPGSFRPASIPGGRGGRTYYTTDQYLEFAGRATIFEGVIASTISDVIWTGSGDPQRLRGNHCTVNTFDVIFDEPVMATCGTGCWGTFDITIGYDVPEAQWGILRAYNLSAADGSVELVRDYSVWLTPEG